MTKLIYWTVCLAAYLGTVTQFVNCLPVNEGIWDGEVVFIGDSITAHWVDDGQVIWDQYYAPLSAENVGVSGDTTNQTIDRLLQGMIDDFNSRLAVLLIGTNDLSYNIPEQTVADQIEQILTIIKERVPGIRILLLGILPRGDGSNGDMDQKVCNVNQLIQYYDDGDSVRFLDMENQFSTSLGEVIPELYWDDLIHLKTEGYQVWAETMQPLFDEMYNSNNPTSIDRL